MKRATGKTNASGHSNKVSIQLALDGHPFSTEELTAALASGDGTVEVELLTPRTMLVPQELFDEALAVRTLEAAGLAPVEGEEVVWSAPRESIVAVMAFDGRQLDAIRSAGGSRILFTTPLLALQAKEFPCIRVHRAGGLLYIKVFEAGLRMAEVIAPANEAEAIYFFERLKEEFPPQEFVAVLTGENPRELRRSVGKGYQRVICE